MGNDKITLLLAVLFGLSVIANAQEVLTQEQGYQGQAAIWDDWVVWRDVQQDLNNSSNIFAKNLTDMNADPIQLSFSNSAGPPAIHGNTVVWADQRNGDYDLFSYNLSTNTPADLYVAPGDQLDPVIYYDNVVFRNNPPPDSNQIWLYSISQDMAGPISIAPGYKWKPDISENYIVWGDYRDGNWDIYGYDINAQYEFPIAQGPHYQRSASISGDIVVFEDTVSPSDNSNIGILKLEWDDPNYIYVPGIIDWLDIDGQVLVWGEYGQSERANIYGYNLANPNQPDFTVCTQPGWQYKPVIYESTIVYSSDNEETSQQFYDRDIFCVEINDINESQDRTSTGTVFEFKVGNIVILDDMESYDPYIEMIWYYWDNPDWTGSWIGLGTDPWQPVYNDARAMEFSYDNAIQATSGGYY